MHTNHIEAFRGAILSAGLTPPDNISDDGKLIRFNGTGKRGTTKTRGMCFTATVSPLESLETGQQLNPSSGQASPTTP